MPLEEPSWWYAGADNDARVRALKPVSRIYAWAALRRLRNAKPCHSRLPVICVGNFTAGGTGKTPLSLLIARLLIERGATPAFLTRGYSGKRTGPLWVDANLHTARDVGDEPLLLAEVAPTMLARDRPAGARAIVDDTRFTHIVMDDGLQNPTLAKSLTIAVVDGTRGMGNGEVIPAGPLRAPLDVQFELADAIVVNGGGEDSKVLRELRAVFQGPVLSAAVVPQQHPDAPTLHGAAVVAYAGIGNPARFIASLQKAGALVAASRFFKDHHHYSQTDARELIKLAAANGARLVTTAKDMVRLSGNDAALAELRKHSQPLRIAMQLEDRDLHRLLSLIETASPTNG
ncbi:MAG: tetraacyldisaccharide 4'-kinase [Alphaproteobacteria bacterium]|nr:tetraacyldisaccharide 4'-kinase [Alphaproteobacteria bacterium]